MIEGENKSKIKKIIQMEYYNLTQSTGQRTCYFRSTDIEQKNWKRLLWSFPDEMLYLMAEGEKIEIIDKSTKKRNKIERIFIPVMDDLLNWLYYNRSPKNKLLINHFKIAMGTIARDNKLKTKFMFWKKHIKKVNLEGRTIQVEREPGYLPRLFQ